MRHDGKRVPLPLRSRLVNWRRKLDRMRGRGYVQYGA
jgi:hypothetical protein